MFIFFAIEGILRSPSIRITGSPFSARTYERLTAVVLFGCALIEVVWPIMGDVTRWGRGISWFILFNGCKFKVLVQSLS